MIADQRSWRRNRRFSTVGDMRLVKYGCPSEPRLLPRQAMGVMATEDFARRKGSTYQPALGLLRPFFLPRRRFPVLLTIAVIFGVLAPRQARAIRPFVTDDARVVGRGHVQLEMWWRRDRLSLQHWVLPAVGPTDWLELSLGGVQGLGHLGKRPDKPRYALGGPVFQSKFLLRETVANKPPGVAVAVGGLAPAGRGGAEAPGWSGFSYLAVTQAFIKEDDFLIHANVGVSTVAAPGLDPAKLTWGIGTQVETVFNFHLIGEIFSGDPYVQTAGAAYQAGFRMIFDDHVQLDGTWGGGVWGDSVMPFWVSSGIRVVTHELF